MEPPPDTTYVYLSFAHPDAAAACALQDALEAEGIRCWSSSTDADPGVNWGRQLVEAIDRSAALVVLVTPRSTESPWVRHEVQTAVTHRIPVVACRIEAAEAPLFWSMLQSVNGDPSDAGATAMRIVEALGRAVPDLRERASRPALPARTEPKAKGYLFVSYCRGDAGFVRRLLSVLEAKQYGYWDYVVGRRDYHGALYRELEERIDGAAAFVTVLSEGWRESDWVAAEFIYAREAGKPIFVLQAGSLERPCPILINLQTRIDMSRDFDEGARVLVEVLSEEGL